MGGHLRSVLAGLATVVFFLLGSPAVADCVVTGPDYADVWVYSVNGHDFYEEERHTTTRVIGLAVPASGVYDGGTWIYEETNGMAGLQRGGSLEVCTPGGCFARSDPKTDETCGGVPDQLLAGISR